MRKHIILSALVLVLMLALATVLWAQGTPSHRAKAMSKVCAMHTQSQMPACCEQSKASCCKNECTPGACTCCGKDMTCCKDGQCQNCCTHTENGMQCTMPDCRQTQGATHQQCHQQ